jgi:hypothetical protein
MRREVSLVERSNFGKLAVADTGSFHHLPLSLEIQKATLVS